MTAIPLLLRKSRDLRNQEVVPLGDPTRLIPETMCFLSFYLCTARKHISRAQRNSKEAPMIELRPFSKLGSADHGWLKAKHHFSFGSHYDPANMGHGALRVWNDDEIAPNTGFPAHPHANMEIITYVREGAITHQDSLGNKGRTEAGDVQVMSAGSGIRHSEYNLESTETRLFQIWIEPSESGGKTSWGAKQFPKGDRSGRFVTLASGLRSRSIRNGTRIWYRPAGGSKSMVSASRPVTVRPSPAWTRSRWSGSR